MASYKNYDTKNTDQSQRRNYPARVQPNHFVAVQITNPKIHSDLRKIQADIIQQNASLQEAAIPLATLHITLLVMSLTTEEEIARARDALEYCGRKLGHLKANPLSVTVAGLGNFRNTVVFAKIQEGPERQQLQHIAETVRACFAEYGILSTDKRDFNIHITIFKLSQAPYLRRKGLTAIEPGLYQDSVDAEFGEQIVGSLQICRMVRREHPEAYYSLLAVEPLAKSETGK